MDELSLVTIVSSGSSEETPSFSAAAHARDAYTQKQMTLEEAFLALEQTMLSAILRRVVPRGMDYYASGLEMGVFRLLHPVIVVEEKCISEIVLGQHVPHEGHTAYQKGPEKANKIFREMVLEYHADVLHAAVIAPDHTPEGHNFYIVRRSSFETKELEAIAQRGAQTLAILDYSNQYYRAKNRFNPWRELLTKIQRIVVRADPLSDWPFAVTGLVRDWIEQDPDGYGRAGLLVEPAVGSMYPVLDNCPQREKYGCLIGKQVRYLLRDDPSVMVPVGDLVAVVEGRAATYPSPP